MRYFRNNPKAWLKGATSPVTEADIAVDAILRQRLLAARPDYGWLSEETEDDGSRLAARRVFVVDPIDGTKSFIAGNDDWAISAAVVAAGRPVAGVIVRAVLAETYAA